MIVKIGWRNRKNDKVGTSNQLSSMFSVHIWFHKKFVAKDLKKQVLKFFSILYRHMYIVISSFFHGNITFVSYLYRLHSLHYSTCTKGFIFMLQYMRDDLVQCLPFNINNTVFIWYMNLLCLVQYFIPVVLISFAYIR